MVSIGIDLGGTNIAAAVVSPQGEILARCSLATPQELGADLPGKVANTMAEAVKVLLKEGNFSLEQAKSIGIGAPGTIDPVGKSIGYWSNLDFRDVPLVALFTQALAETHSKIPPIYLENDANAAALGEFFAGAGKNAQSLVAITLGTGVGGGAVVKGKLFTGFNYAGLEVGHFVLQTGGKPCTCGRLGCFEAYCSATALISATKTAMAEHKHSLLWELVQGDLSKVNGKLAFDGAKQGDRTAQTLVEDYIFYLASGVVSLINLFQPEIFCIGGGIAGQGEDLLRPLLEIVNKEDYARNLPQRCNISLARLGNDAGIIGAAVLGDGHHTKQG